MVLKWIGSQKKVELHDFFKIKSERNPTQSSGLKRRSWEGQWEGDRASGTSARVTSRRGPGPALQDAPSPRAPPAASAPSSDDRMLVLQGLRVWARRGRCQLGPATRFWSQSMARPRVNASRSPAPQRPFSAPRRRPTPPLPARSPGPGPAVTFLPPAPPPCRPPQRAACSDFFPRNLALPGRTRALRAPGPAPAALGSTASLSGHSAQRSVCGRVTLQGRSPFRVSTSEGGQVSSGSGVQGDRECHPAPARPVAKGTPLLSSVSLSLFFSFYSCFLKDQGSHFPICHGKSESPNFRC